MAWSNDMLFIGICCNDFVLIDVPPSTAEVLFGCTNVLIHFPIIMVLTMIIKVTLKHLQVQTARSLPNHLGNHGTHFCTVQTHHLGVIFCKHLTQRFQTLRRGTMIPRISRYSSRWTSSKSGRSCQRALDSTRNVSWLESSSEKKTTPKPKVRKTHKPPIKALDIVANLVLLRQIPHANTLPRELRGTQPFQKPQQLLLVQRFDLQLQGEEPSSLNSSAGISAGYGWKPRYPMEHPKNMIKGADSLFLPIGHTQSKHFLRGLQNFNSCSAGCMREWPKIHMQNGCVRLMYQLGLWELGMIDV